MSTWEKWGLAGEDAHTADIMHSDAEGLGDTGVLYRETLFDNVVEEKAKKDATETRGQNWEPVGGILIADKESHEHELVHRLLKQERGMPPTEPHRFLDAVEDKLSDGIPDDAELITDTALAEKYSIPVEHTWAVLAETEDAYEAVTKAGEQVFWEPIQPNMVHGVDWDELEIVPNYSSGIDEFLARYLTPDDTTIDAEYYDIDPYRIEDAIRRLDAAVDYNPGRLVTAYTEFDSRDELLDTCFAFQAAEDLNALNGSFYGDQQQKKITEYTLPSGSG